MSNLQINLIWAQGRNRVIGKDGKMPWHLPEDLAHFKRVTLGHPVIMGRKTWDSLPPRFRPLPGRINIVISRAEDFLADQLSGTLRTATSLAAALELTCDAPEVWVIGGAQIYAQALPLAHKVVVTRIDEDFEGDAFAPAIDDTWTRVQHEAHTAASGLPYAFSTYQRH